MRTTGLKIDYCSFAAVKYACVHWHYSGTVPVGKMVRIGVWENGEFTRAVIFSRGVIYRIGEPYGLTQTEVCELTRVAMREHETPVSKILSESMRLLKRVAPGVKLVESFADVDQGQTGKIYQAHNWIYEGKKNVGVHTHYFIDGKKVHNRTLGARYGNYARETVLKHHPNAVPFRSEGKHKYLYPLTKAMRRQVEQLAQPYPDVP